MPNDSTHFWMDIQCHNYLPVVKKFTSYLEIKRLRRLILTIPVLVDMAALSRPFRRYCKRSATLSKIDNSSISLSSVDNPVEDRPVSNPARTHLPPQYYRHNSQTFQQNGNLSSITDHHPFCTFSHQQHGISYSFASAHISRSFCVFPLKVAILLPRAWRHPPVVAPAATQAEQMLVLP